MNIENRVKKIIGSIVSSSENDIGINCSLIQLGIDSLSSVELIVALEDEFEIIFDDAELNLKTLKKVEDIINLVKKHVEV